MFSFLILISAIVFVVIDSIYLSTMKPYFQRQIQRIQGSSIEMNLVGALLCYTFLITGLYYFIIQPRKDVKEAFLLGIVIYGVYETTNYALFKKWSLLTVFIDTLWGGLLFAMTTYIVQLFRKIV